MGAIRILVDDVDEAIAAFQLAGFELGERWGPPFAVLVSGDTELWISGAGTSAAKLTAQLAVESRASASVRPVHQVDDLDAAEKELGGDGWTRVAGPISGPGGSQVLLARGSAFLEVFAGT
jgi:hypothetical protein